MKLRVGIPKDMDLRKLMLGSGLALILLFGQPWLWNRVLVAAARFRDRQTQEEQLGNVNQLVDKLRNVEAVEQGLLEQTLIPFPVQGDAPQLVERLEGLAQNKGLAMTLESIVEREVTKKSKQKLIPLDLTFSVSGSPRSVLSFFDAMEHMQEFNQVQTWALTTVPGVRQGGVAYGAQITLRFYQQQSN